MKGADAARDFIDKVTRLAVGALMETGCTTGIDDADVPEDALEQIVDAQKKAVKKAVKKAAKKAAKKAVKKK